LIGTAASGEPKPKAPKATARRRASDRGLDSASARIPSKQIQITKQKSLDFLGFIRPNQDFSMGYEQKNKKKSTPVSVCAKTSQGAFHPFLPRPARRARRGSSPRLRKA
jgi:hypothetical protein